MSLRKGGDSVVTLVSWVLWKERNARCFRDESASAVEMVGSVKLLVGDWVRAGASAFGCLMRV